MLILFDIDATLLTTQRAGVFAMGDAGRRLFGDSFDESRVEYAGRLDPLIIIDLLRAHEQPFGPAEIDAFRAGYGEALASILTERQCASALPGVLELLAGLETVDGVTVGLLTGNFPETGAIKLRAAGLDPDRFTVQVWGCDSPHDPPARDHLPAVAIDRHHSLAGARLPGERVVIIGDTIHDIACARAHGCRSIGTATGVYSRDDLAAAGADLAVNDLSDTEGLMQWLMAPMNMLPAKR